MQSSERSCWRSLELRNAINEYTVLLYTEDTSVKHTYTFIHLTYEHFHWFFSSISWNNKNKNTKKKHKQTHKQTRTRNTCTDKMYTTHELTHLKNRIKLQ